LVQGTPRKKENYRTPYLETSKINDSDKEENSEDIIQKPAKN
jgi:hypothetical protein